MLIIRSPVAGWSKLKIAVFSVIGGSVVLYGPMKNSIGLPYFVKLHTLRSVDNKLVSLPLELHQFAEDVRNEVRLSVKKKDDVKFFFSNDLDMVILGSLHMIYGAHIGLPFTFKYERVDEFDSKMFTSIVGENRFRRKDWYNTDNGKKLINSLVLSKDARTFAIAKGMASADSESILLQDIISISCIGIGFYLYDKLEPRLAKHIGKISTILILGTVLSIFCSTILTASFDLVDHMKEKKADEFALKNPKDAYRNGATEYYEKMIERNKQLRALMIDGPRRFDADGNPISWYKYSFKNLREMLDNCKKIIETWKDDSPII